jgi:hypothetical protein
MSMGMKRFKVQDENGNVFSVNAPANSTPEEVSEWINSEEGMRATMAVRRDREASNFAGKNVGSLWQGPTMPDKREISGTEAVLGQAGHAANKLGANIGSFAEKYFPGFGLTKDAVNAVAGTSSEDVAKKTEQKLSEGRAFVERTKELGYPNYGGAAVNTLAHATAMAYPPLRTTRMPYLANTLAQGLVQANIGAATADEGERADNAADAFIGSTLGDLALGGLARVAKPVWNVSRKAKLLADKGIYATPMAASGRALKALEDKFMSIPGAGDILAFGRRKGIEDYNKEIIADAAGGPLKGKGFGNEAFDEVMDRFNVRYDNALNNLSLNVHDPAIPNAFNRIVRSNELDAKGAQTFNNTWSNWHANRPSSNPIIDGEKIQMLTEKYLQRANKFQKSPDPYHQQTGDAYSDAREALFDAVARQKLGSGDVNELKNINRDYANFVPVMAAGNRAGASLREGVFSPAEGLGALRQTMERRGQSRDFLRKRGHNQRVHQAANDVLGSAYPDSGTAGRLAVTSLALGGGSGIADANTDAGMAAYAPMAAILAYTAATGSKSGRKYFMGGYKGQNYLSEKLRDSMLRKGVSAYGASVAGDDPSITNLDIYEPWGK